MTRESLFARALLHADMGCPPGLRAHNGSDPAVRFNVHRNNIVASLVAAMSDTFPVTRQVVGDEFFEAMARVFIVEHPPTSPLLCDYGETFAAFVESFAPAAPVPYLADVARLEHSRVRAYHAADAAPLSREEIAARLSDPAALAGSQVEFHPSAHIVRSDFAIVSLWAAHQGHGDISRVDPFSPEAALVLREDGDAAVVCVPLPSAIFLCSLRDGATLAQSADEAGRAGAALGAPFDLSATLGILIRHRALTAWRPSPESAS
jgi:hypothetical protein